MLSVFRHFVPIPTLLLAVVEGALLTAALYFMLPAHEIYGLTNPVWLQFSIALSLSAVIAMTAVGLYSADAFFDRRVALVRVPVALVLMAPITFLATALLEVSTQAPEELGSMWRLKAAVAWLICLLVTRAAFSRLSDLDIFKRRSLVLGTGKQALNIREIAKDRARAHFVPVGFLNVGCNPNLVGGADCDLKLGGLHQMAHALKAQEIVIATDDRRGLPVEELLQCKLSDIAIVDYLTFCERETGRVDLDALRPSWFLFSHGFRVGVVPRFIKRTSDLVISGAVLIFVLPLLILTACAIKCESRGPIFYRQERVGWRGRKFVLFKFRSMRIDAESNGAPQWAQANDPRMTHVGAFIRMVRIDELPQLLNVIRGDMSFVGPRPERPYFVDLLAQEIRFYGERHAIRPGITGWAQINYRYGASIEDARQKLSYDLYYLKNRSLFLDLVILTQTLRVVLWRDAVR